MRQLTCYQIHNVAPRIIPARSERAWMDETGQRFAYRCLPLTIANAMGWEVLCPAGVKAEWNGGNDLSDIKVEIDTPAWDQGRFAISHFGHGVLTFQLGYLFRTEPGIGIWARGVPNLAKDGIAPLEGIIETDWMPFTFTMNWRFTRPGMAEFAKDEPFCFVTLVGYRQLEKVEPEVVMLKDAPEIQEQFRALQDSRNNFNEGLKRQDSATVKEGWQKWYFRGEQPLGDASPHHTSKIKLAAPKYSDAPGKPE